MIISRLDNAWVKPVEHLMKASFISISNIIVFDLITQKHEFVLAHVLKHSIKVFSFISVTRARWKVWVIRCFLLSRVCSRDKQILTSKQSERIGFGS